MPKDPAERLPAPNDEILPEHDAAAEDFRRGLQGKYVERYAPGRNLVLLDPNATAVFPDSEAVNRALRALAGIIKDRAESAAQRNGSSAPPRFAGSTSRTHERDPSAEQFRRRARSGALQASRSSSSAVRSLVSAL